MEKKEDKKYTDMEDKDFGFPFVEVLPLDEIEEAKKHVIAKESTSTENHLEEESIESTEVTKKELSVKPLESMPATSTKVGHSRVETYKDSSKKNKGNGLYLILSLFVVLILASMGYFFYYLPAMENQQLKANLLNTSDIESSSQDAAILTEKKSDNDESLAQNESTEDGLISGSSEILSQVKEPVLTVIEGRSSSPRYFIVVGSVLNERHAQREAQKYLEDGYDTWIIHPYGEISNFRIAIGQFESLEASTPDWEAAKNVYGKEIWILKY
ncbi:hypothetical protein ACFOUP_08975 [Belliella kenyensis]|uniref:SPOR domain-containing protein n=1 Tax=Belliella kenyensis TaxID=1472724 RepID=A0ABV8ELT4_9BACT|nr:hypothetical protein [Belliella kenyensis]MCH7403763.1 hypothetical protein [Belliella kenyensis]MDN3604433.1 hypothetical protein [Belliella kenyensis]